MDFPPLLVRKSADDSLGTTLTSPLKSDETCYGLVLTAGGARGAYQAGVLKRIGEIRSLEGRPTPFPIVTGASAGAINGAAIAAGADNFRETTRRLAQVWSEIQIGDVFRTDTLAFGGIAAKWIRDLSFGAIFGGGSAQSLLDASPLRGFIAKQIPFGRIQPFIERGLLYALGVNATNYHSGKSYTFIQGRSGHPIWERSRRLAYPVKMGVEHILASSAIPIVFPPVLIRADFGDYYYGDGALRLIAPFSPAIRLGANRVFAIGIRSQRASEETTQADLGGGKRPVMRRPPVLAEILGVALNSIFLDHLDADLDHLVRMNELIMHYVHSGSAVSSPPRDAVKTPMRIVLPLVVNPSVDLGKLAEDFSRKLPLTIRYLLEGLGSSRSQSSDLMSYMLFDPSYCRALVDIGYRDAGERIAEVEQFLVEALR